MQVEVAVDIAATPQRVWEVIRDVEHWPEWTPSITSIQRLDRKAASLGPDTKARIRQPGLPTMVWKVTKFEPCRGFTWETRNWGAVTIGEHWITPSGRDSSRVELKVRIDGLLEPLFRPWLVRMTRKNMEMEAQGLKRRCELAQA